MKTIVISDIHANITALEAVLQSAGEFEAIWCLGDIVGYGPDPNECTERIRSLPNMICLMGNHDAAVCGNKNIDSFNEEAGEAILLTRKLISAPNLAFLKSLPEKESTDLVTLAHGSPRNPIWEYIIDTYTAHSNFSYFESFLALVGHTHLPIMFFLDSQGEKAHRRILKSDSPAKLNERSILNPGSVGQPRDHNPRASYGILDTDALTWEIRRIEYDIKSVQKRIHSLGFPEKHALRLAEGW